eukprot:COSAG01_NODE_5508_length_4212_cov_27.624449_2_plen_127_part_00
MAGRGSGAAAHRRVHNRVHGSDEQMRAAANFRAGTVWVGGIPRACAQAYSARQAFASWMRSMLTDIYLCRTCSCREILRMENARTGGREAGADPRSLTVILGARCVAARRWQRGGGGGALPASGVS